MNRIIRCRNCKVNNRVPASYPENRRPICASCKSVLGSRSSNESRSIDDIKRELLKVRNYIPRVGVFGDTGAGKSSLCNALFGKPIAKVSNIEACTRRPQEIFLSLDSGQGITLIDVPGVGEDPTRHKEYMELYKSLSKELDLILWVIKADDRKYLSAIDVYKEVLEPNLIKCPVIFVITQVDKIEPYKEWDFRKNIPSYNQLKNLNVKISDVSKRFNIGDDRIVAVSSSEHYNLSLLVSKVVEVLPNKKKYSFVREVKDENVKEDTSIKAEKGIIDHIKDYAGRLYEKYRDEIDDLIIEGIKKAVPKIAARVFKFFRKRSFGF